MSLEKDLKKKKEKEIKKYKNELQKYREMLSTSLRMSFSSLLGYSHMLTYYNKKLI